MQPTTKRADSSDNSQACISVELEPAGHRLLVRPDPVEDMSSGLIYKPEIAKEMERRATATGEIIAIGFTSWKGFADGEPWAKVGDRVLFSRYAGIDVPTKWKDEFDPSAERLVVLNDEDIALIKRRIKR